MDDSPELIARALHKWCTGSRSGAKLPSSDFTILPGLLWENPFVESFDSRLWGEFVGIELFLSFTQAKAWVGQHRIE
jgi:hypothetical protein